MAKARILLVEDDPVIQVVVRSMLQVLGNQVEMAEDGREAVDLVSHRRYDLILMDCQMPRMDGFEATRLIRERERGISVSGRGCQLASRDPWRSRVPIVAITTSARSRQRCLDSGMDDYLEKPFEQPQLSDYLERWLPRERARGLDAEYVVEG